MLPSARTVIINRRNADVLQSASIKPVPYQSLSRVNLYDVHSQGRLDSSSGISPVDETSSVVFLDSNLTSFPPWAIQIISKTFSKIVLRSSPSVISVRSRCPSKPIVVNHRMVQEPGTLLWQLLWRRFSHETVNISSPSSSRCYGDCFFDVAVSQTSSTNDHQRF
ncbi:hypothetical protein J6590_071174 [Homalodisca vitripennis]|nr:hypothetical protein J6590_071174 [Homalodisca vitripennis]